MEELPNCPNCNENKDVKRNQGKDTYYCSKPECKDQPDFTRELSSE